MKPTGFPRKATLLSQEVSRCPARAGKVLLCFLCIFVAFVVLIFNRLMDWKRRKEISHSSRTCGWKTEQEKRHDDANMSVKDKTLN